MTYRKTIEIRDQHSLNEHEIIELLNALSSQAAYAKAFRAHAIETTGIDPANLKKVVKPKESRQALRRSGRTRRPRFQQA